LCPWEGILLHITTPHTIWDVGVLPRVNVAGPRKSMANLDKRKDNLFEILKIKSYPAANKSESVYPATFNCEILKPACIC
jgi:hypothetical protein